MIKVNAIVTSVRAYDVNGTITIKLGTNAKFDGFVRHVDNVTGVISFERATTDSIVMTIGQLLHFVNDNSPLYAYLFAGIAPINISQKVGVICSSEQRLRLQECSSLLAQNM